jgi:hypothetical protein
MMAVSKKIIEIAVEPGIVVKSAQGRIAALSRL